MPSLRPTETSLVPAPSHLHTGQNTAIDANLGSNLVSTRPAPGRRALRRRIIVQNCVLSSVVIGQLAAYPKLMIEGSMLPPFIHPPCHVDEELAPRCKAMGRHFCLPTTLGVCSGIVELFYARTSSNREFVWQTIQAELGKLERKVRRHLSKYKQPVVLMR
jgi:hypothetical protein